MAHLYVHGQHTGHVEAVLRRDSVWAAPLLWRSEFHNTLIGVVRKQTLALDEAARLTSEAERFLAGAEYAVASASVLGLAARSTRSAYDCEFVALARDLDARLVTADHRLLRAFPETAVSLEDFTA